MIRYIIKNKATGKFLKRTKGYKVESSWVDSADDATLITTGSAASQIANQFCPLEPERYSYGRRFRMDCQDWIPYPVLVIKVNCLLIPVGAQPFIDTKKGVSNAHVS